MEAGSEPGRARVSERTVRALESAGADTDALVGRLPNDDDPRWWVV
jgi:hypothetical protein